MLSYFLALGKHLWFPRNRRTREVYFEQTCTDLDPVLERATFEIP